MNRQARRHPPKVMPPAVAFLDAMELMGSGSPLYRVHRPAHVLGHELDWLTFVTAKHSPPEGKQPWLIEIEGQALCPNVLVLRPTMLSQLGEEVDQRNVGEKWDDMRRHVYAAQRLGQIVLLDLDDHPYAWNEFQIREGHPENAFDKETWEAHDAYVESFNAVLCSTIYLQWKVMQPRFGERQQFHYAPNLYDPWRYDPSKAHFGHSLGSHLYVKARDADDFAVLGDALRPMFEADDKLSFVHIGEEYLCRCGHRRDEHWENRDECDHCACGAWEDGGSDSLARIANLPSERIFTIPPVSPYVLPDELSSFNTGVVPLADSEWNWCKTEGKGFEMAAAGLPFLSVTGHHPLYLKAPPFDAKSLTTDEFYWTNASSLARAWAEQIAKEHQIDYVATMRRLSSSNLAK